MSEELTFGSWLRQRRKELSITQEELAERLGFSSIMLWKIEARERRTSSQIVALLADYFHIPIDERKAFVIFARTGSVGSIALDNDGEGASVSPWRATVARHTNLPIALAPLIGREEAEDAILDLFLKPRSRVRLLTLTGAPGIGKTRLAAHMLLSRCSLGPLGSPFTGRVCCALRDTGSTTRRASCAISTSSI